MEKHDIERLRAQVSCAAVAERAGFKLDRRESTRRALKFRRGGDLVIIIHEGQGWFDPLSDAKGDVFSLAIHLGEGGFGEALSHVADLVGFRPSAPAWRPSTVASEPTLGIAERWRSRRRPAAGSTAWRYLRVERCLPDAILRAALRADLLREGPRGSIWAAHTDETGAVTGWEARGPEWRGFSTGGAKVLFRLPAADASAAAAPRLCVTEAAIDAMSLAAIEGLRDGSLYLSTGGGWSSATAAAVRSLAARPGARLVAATDDNAQGRVFAERLLLIAEEAGCDWQRLKPSAEDWNQVLKEKAEEARERGTERGGRLP